MRRRWLGILIFAPLVLGGCGSGGTPSAAPTPSGSPWIIYLPGNAAASQAPSGAGTPSAFPTGFLPLPSGSVTASPSGSPACPREISHGIAGATVVPGRTSAAVTFYNPGGSDLVEYRVTAISQDLVAGPQRDVGWTVLTPGSGCGFLTATVTGLDPKTHYVFSVDAVTTRLGMDGTQAATVARSLVVQTT
ncbi:fibronectin type III domain-containing protein [Actinoplanes sp. KI2]|uniref:fibronectin type III domain-containing protein n=1 Tax=Actinoplanes sp. KI2 TaxID=2983315 RepID=UPI0021D5E1FB|nr:fibronectin type III domain-containing protein [Actinoplanes sp. KI2]MCU7724701.1 fibronectin type III domain-containing protein [Actinoplanes sp. KI2]